MHVSNLFCLFIVNWACAVRIQLIFVLRIFHFPAVPELLKTFFPLLVFFYKLFFRRWLVILNVQSHFVRSWYYYYSNDSLSLLPTFQIDFLMNPWDFRNVFTRDSAICCMFKCTCVQSGEDLRIYLSLRFSNLLSFIVTMRYWINT